MFNTKQLFQYYCIQILFSIDNENAATILYYFTSFEFNSKHLQKLLFLLTFPGRKGININIYDQETGSLVFRHNLFEDGASACENSIVAYKNSFVIANTYEPRPQRYLPPTNLILKILPCKEPKPLTLEPKEPHRYQYQLHRKQIENGLDIPPHIVEHYLSLKGEIYEWTDDLADEDVPTECYEGRDQFEHNDYPMYRVVRQLLVDQLEFDFVSH